MNLNDLIAEQDKELKEYWLDRERLSNNLKEAHGHLLCELQGVSSKNHEILKNMMDDQRRSFEEAQNQELDLLRFAHDYHREQLFNEQQMQRSMMEKIKSFLKKDREYARGR